MPLPVDQNCCYRRADCDTDSGYDNRQQGSGAWHELGDCAVSISPEDPEQMAQALNAALTLTSGEKAVRMLLLKQRIHNASLARWWQSLQDEEHIMRDIA